MLLLLMYLWQFFLECKPAPLNLTVRTVILLSTNNRQQTTIEETKE